MAEKHRLSRRDLFRGAAGVGARIALEGVRPDQGEANKPQILLPKEIVDGESRPLEANVKSFRRIDFEARGQDVSLEIPIDYPLGVTLNEIKTPSGKFIDVRIDISVFTKFPTGSFMISFTQEGSSIVTGWRVCFGAQELKRLLEAFPERQVHFGFPFLINTGEPLPTKYANVFDAPEKGEIEGVRVSFFPEAYRVASGGNGGLRVVEGGVPSAIWDFTNLGHPQKKLPSSVLGQELKSV